MLRWNNTVIRFAPIARPSDLPGVKPFPLPEPAPGAGVATERTRATGAAADRKWLPRGRRAAALAICASLAVAAVGAGGSAEAQDVLVSNIRSATTTAVRLGADSTSEDAVQLFTTGTNAAGYTLTSIVVGLHNTRNNSHTAPTVKVHNVTVTSTSVTLGTAVATLTISNSFVANDSDETYTAPSGTSLAASTTYGVFADGGAKIFWDGPGDGNENDNAAAGWSIGDQAATRGHDSTGVFTLGTDGPVMIQVNGTAKPSVLVSNLGSATTTSVRLGADSTSEDAVQLFTTGTNAAGYTLTSIALGLYNSADRSNTAPTVKVHNVTVAGTSVTLGTAVATLTFSDSLVSNLDDTHETYTAPSDTSLAASTTYGVFADGGAKVFWDGYVDGDEHTKAAGWSIGDQAAIRAHDATGVFTLRTDGPVMIEVNGTAKSGSNTAPTGAPTITGTPTVGQTLTAVTTAIMDTDGLTTPGYTYQWIRVATDNTETNIAMATASTYTLVSEDLGTTIKVKVSFTDDASNAETLTSVATAAVAAALDTTPPTLVSATVVPNGSIMRFQFSENLDGSNLPPVTAFTVTADGNTITNNSTSQVPGSRDGVALSFSPPYIRQGQAVVITYTDPTGGDDTAAIQDTAGNDVETFTTGMNSVPAVINNSTVATAVPNNWSLKPTGLAAGAQFRLLFLSSTKRDATATEIATYNTFIQNLAAAGHTEIRAYSAGFRVVGCTAATDARDNTGTTGAGVPIYWLNGTKVADDYADFYDGSWDDEANDKNESGTDAHDTALSVNHPYTGCQHNGTESSGTSRALGTSNVSVGTPNSSTSGAGPIGTNTNFRVPASNTRPLYGLSALFQVAAAVVNSPATGALTITGTAQVGQTLTAVTTAIMDGDGLTTPGYTYQWIRVATDNTETNIAMATASTYTLVTEDQGTTIKVKVSFTDDASNAETLTSVATAAVAAAPNTAATGAPTITGTAQVGQTLTAVTTAIMDTDGLTTPGYTYQWIRVAADTTETNISMATAGTYTLVTDDLGTTIKVKVSFTDDASNPETLTSAATTAVAAADTTAPTLLSAEVQGTGAIINLKFDEILMGRRGTPLPAEVINALTLTVDSVEIAIGLSTFSQFSSADVKVQPVGGKIIRQGQTVVVTYTDPTDDDDARALQDLAGNDVATFTTGQNSVPTVTNNSTVAPVAPGAPTRLTATASGGSQIALSWTAPADNGGRVITGYKIEISPNGTDTWTDRVANTADANTTYAHTGLSDSTTRHYRVSAINIIGTSSTSNVDSATTADTTPPRLTSATVSGSGGSIALAFSEDLQSANLPLAAAFTVTVGGTPVTVSGVAAGAREDVLQITVSPLIGQGQAVVVAYEDPTNGNDANAIQDTAGNDTPDFTTGAGDVPAVTNNAALTNEVLSSWSLKPTGLVAGDQFRLLFLSSTKRNATATDIATYNTFIQNLAAAGHTDIRTYSAGFRAVGCTAAVDARDNTSTTGTGVPIYWLDGTKVADDYADFYDGSWDDEINDTNESGTDAHDTSQTTNYPFTGCANDGTEEFAGATNPRGLGATTGFVRVGRLNASGTLQDPIDGNDTAQTTDTRPLYGLSAVFEVTTVDTTSPKLVSATVTSLGLGTVIRMDFDEKLKRPSGGQFPAAVVSLITVTVDGVEVDLSARASTDGISVNLHLQAGAKIRSGQTVVIAYFDDTSGNDPLVFEDNAGNDVATFTTGMNGVPPVTNNSTVAPVAPGAPTGLTATANGSAQIDLSWTAPADNGGRVITGYKIEVSSDAGNAWTTHLADTTSADTTYEHTGLAAGTTRHYRVSAINTIGTSPASNVDDATTGAGTNNTAVPNNWSLKPTGLAVGYQFRLLFLSSTKRNAQATDIAVYNTFIQTLAAAGHTDIRDYSAGFRVVGCTADTDARDNTSTGLVNHTGTGTAKGVPIYWLDGTKAADDYADFYDGSWDDEANDKNESGTNSHDTSMALNYPWTGCGHDGTEAVVGSASFALGTSAAIGSGVGRPNSSAAVNGPLGSDDNAVNTSTRPMYGLSAVFQVATAVVVNNPPTFSANTAARSVAENTAAGQNVGAALTATDLDSDVLTYTLEGADAASFDITSTSGQIRTKAGVTYNHEAKSTYTVMVKADDSNGGTDTVTVTITVTDVNEPPGVPAVPLVSATSGSTTSLDVTWTAPTNTGPAITSYDLQYREGASGSFTAGPQNVTGTSAAIASLMASTSHQVQVRATNAEGDSDWSGSGTGRTGNTAPAFSSSTAARNVAENTAAGQNVGAALTATDANSDTLTYTLEGTDASSFDIDSTSGQIQTKAGVTYNHEAKSTYTVMVKADDSNGGTDTVTVTITVTDVAEPPGVPAPPSVTGTGGSTTSLDVTWTAPTNTGPAITSYDLQYREGTSGSFTDGPQNVTGTSAAIASLMASTSHQVQVRATNAEGDGAWSGSGTGRTGASVPGAPTGLMATANGNTRIDLSWTAPGSNGGSAITGYRIEESPNGNSNWTTLEANTNGPATTYSHTGLAAGTTRHYRVSAINSNGAGAPSNVDGATTGTTVPGAPTGLVATASGNTRINLSWTAPAITGGSPITGYRIEVSPDGNSNWSDLEANTNGPATTYSHTGLAAGTTRHYRVSAINSNGAGAASSVDDATTGTTVPDAPTVLTATASGTTRINLSWTAPASDGGSPITGYRIESSPNGNSSWTTLVATTGGAGTTHSDTGLPGGTTRHYRVSAINSNGAGAASNVAGTTTGTSVPGAPTALTAAASGTARINLSWTAPARNGGTRITGYRIEESPDGTSSWTDLVTDTSDTRTTYSHAGLSGGTTRHYRVSAINSNGAGAPSSVDSATTGTSVPGAPTALSARASGTTQVDLSWTAPASDGGSPVTGYRIEESPDGNSSWTVLVATTGSPATTYSRTGLPSGATRHYRVAAVNTNGAGALSNTASTTTGTTVPGAPTSLTAAASGTARIDLAWTAPASDGGIRITGYRIESSLGSGSSWTVLVATTGNTRTTYSDTGLSGGTTRYYRVSAINTNGAGAHSNVDGATTGTTVPDAPTDLAARVSENIRINLSWARPANDGGSLVTGYRIEISSDGGSSWTDLVANTRSPHRAYSHTVNAGATRHYRVSAISAIGTSAHSNVASATTVLRTVRFAADSYTAREGAAAATVAVVLSGPAPAPVTIPLTREHLSGATEADYSGVPAGVTFAAGQARQTFTVTVTEDSDQDGLKRLRLQFGTLPSGYASRPHRTAVVRLVDNDGGLAVSFGTERHTTVRVREHADVRHRFSVYLHTNRYDPPNNNRQQSLTIPLEVTHVGGAEEGVDYTPRIPASVTFAAGQSEASFSIRAIPDGERESGEGLRIDFGPLPSGVARAEWGPYETVEFVDEEPVSLWVSGPLLTMRYPGALDGGSTPSGGDFVVVAGAPGGEAVVPVTSVSVEGEAVLLGLARPVAADETVTLTYLTGAMHPIRDEKGLAAPLADEPVRNETGASGLPAQAGPAGGTAIRTALAGVPEAAQMGAGTERLDLSSQGLTDVSALAGLSGVLELDLADNAIADLSPLAGLTGLQVLNLSGNRVADIATLAGLTELERLNLSDNRIGELSPLAGLSGLKVLDLSGNRIEEVSPLAGLTGLERLNLSGNGIGELLPLAGLGGLQVLLLDGNGIADVLGLSPLAGLENLGLSGNRIADIGLLGQLRGLRRLDLSGNAVADISALGEVSGLLWLRLPGNPVSDIAPLGRLEQLRWLWLDPATAPGMEAWAVPAGRGAAPLWIERVPAR